jgi:DNA-binding SARP family transcriptional activator
VGGYRLNVPPESVDVVLFEQRVRAGRAALEVGTPSWPPSSSACALELWRGSALSDVEGMPFAESEAAGLGEKRVAAIEYLVDAVLAQPTAADAGELLPELEQLRTAFPLREKLHARYMSVLYALGRQAEALAAYGQLRSTLSDRLGVDPSPDLAALHLAMLRQGTGETPPRAAAPSSGPRRPTSLASPSTPNRTSPDPPAVAARPDGPASRHLASAIFRPSSPASSVASQSSNSSPGCCTTPAWSR